MAASRLDYWALVSGMPYMYENSLGTYTAEEYKVPLQECRAGSEITMFSVSDKQSCYLV